jgi:hypothetical protein
MCNSIPTKIPMIFITGIKKSTLKFIWKHTQKKGELSMQYRTKKSHARGLTKPDLKLFYRAITIQRAVEQNRGPGYESMQLSPTNFFIVSFLSLFIYSYVQHCVGYFSPLPLTLILSPHLPCFQAEPVLPFSPILLKRKNEH